MLANESLLAMVRLSIAAGGEVTGTPATFLALTLRFSPPLRTTNMNDRASSLAWNGDFARSLCGLIHTHRAPTAALSHLSYFRIETRKRFRLRCAAEKFPTQEPSFLPSIASPVNHLDSINYALHRPFCFLRFSGPPSPFSVLQRIPFFEEARLDISIPISERTCQIFPILLRVGRTITTRYV
ncbi:hypothetical protein C8R43DRAFT_160137 [Mycena crocata]|nr:hypothetical protein C8R43DRAFT_160137 [Mycena crocata]